MRFSGLFHVNCRILFRGQPPGLFSSADCKHTWHVGDQADKSCFHRYSCRTYFITGHFLWQQKSSSGQNVRHSESFTGQNRILTFFNRTNVRCPALFQGLIKRSHRILFWSTTARFRLAFVNQIPIGCSCFVDCVNPFSQDTESG